MFETLNQVGAQAEVQVEGHVAYWESISATLAWPVFPRILSAFVCNPVLRSITLLRHHPPLLLIIIIVSSSSSLLSFEFFPDFLPPVVHIPFFIFSGRHGMSL